MITQDSLKKIRRTLKLCLAEKHIETDGSLKKCIKETIVDIDREVAKGRYEFDLYQVLNLLGKTIKKLPLILSLLEKLK